MTLAGKLDKKRDGWVDFSAPADEVRCRINGLSPWPSATASYNGAPLKLLRAEPAEGSAEQGGVVIDAKQGVVACGAGAVRLLEAQAPGKPAMEWARAAQTLGLSDGDVIEGTRAC